MIKRVGLSLLLSKILFGLKNFDRRLSEELCGPLCLCGEIIHHKIHHGGTEAAQRTTEMVFSTASISKFALQMQTSCFTTPATTNDLFDIAPNTICLVCRRRGNAICHRHVSRTRIRILGRILRGRCLQRGWPG